MENLLPQNVESVINYIHAVMLLKKPNGELPVAVDRSQLRTLASEKVDPIDWQLPSTQLRAIPCKFLATNH